MGEWNDSTDIKDRHIGTFFRGLKILWQMTGEHKKNIFLVFCLIAIFNTLGTFNNYVLKLIFDEMAKDFAIKSLIVLILAYCAIKFLWAFLEHYVKEPRFLKTIIKLENCWPIKVQEKLLALSLQYHERENTGEKIEKIRKGCDRLVEVTGLVFWSIFPEFIFMMANNAIIVAMNWQLGLLFMAPIVPAMLIQRKMQMKYTPFWIEYSKKQERASGLFCQSIFNRCAVFNFVQEEREKEKFAAVHNEMERIDTKVSTAMQKSFFLITLILTSFLAATICLGGYFVKNGTATVGTVVYIAMAGGYISQNIRNIMNNYNRVVRYMVSIFRMKEMMDTEIDIKDAPDAIIPDEFCGRIALNHVSFLYSNNEAPILNDVSMKINPGEFIGVVGISGSGKTTLTRLLNRLYEANSGDIIFDDKYNMRQLKIHWLRGRFASVEQEIDIFDDTILANISYARPNITEEEAIGALRAAHLDAVLEDKRRFPKGMLQEVGERGVKLSGGERQRVGIARAYVALMQGANILILDEATSDLDGEAEKAIQEMIGTLRKKLQISVIAIAHRLSTIQKADRIYVLEDGRVIEEGDHNGLIALRGRYNNLVNLQKLATAD